MTNPSGRLYSVVEYEVAMPTYAFTISKLADAAGIGVEAVRYYQKRGLLAEPNRVDGGFRHYTIGHVRRLQFIKRAQELGFSLDDVAQLISLSTLRDKSRARELTRRRVAEIRGRIAALEAVASALESLADRCKRSSASEECPIIAAVVGELPSADANEAPGHARSRARARALAEAQP